MANETAPTLEERARAFIQNAYPSAIFDIPKAMADFARREIAAAAEKLVNEHHEHQQCDLCDQQDMWIARLERQIAAATDAENRMRESLDAWAEIEDCLLNESPIKIGVYEFNFDEKMQGWTAKTSDGKEIGWYDHLVDAWQEVEAVDAITED